MARFDNRNSMKMRRRKAQRKKKERARRLAETKRTERVAPAKKAKGK